MPIDSGARQRLMDLMEDRRLELGITWRELCERAEVSYETIRNFRQGKGGRMRGLTESNLERTLGWDRGAIGRVLEGGAACPPGLPDLVTDNWDDPNVVTLWGLRVSAEQRLALVAAYLRDGEGEESG